MTTMLRAALAPTCQSWRHTTPSGRGSETLAEPRPKGAVSRDGLHANFSKFAVAAMLAAATLAAQRPAERKKTPAKPAAAATADSGTLTSVEVTGNKAFSAEVIARASGLETGRVVTSENLRRSVELLTATGAFETLSYRYRTEGGKLAVTFEVQEVADLYPVGFERLGKPDADLAKLLGDKVPLFGSQIPATGAMIKRIVDALEGSLGMKVAGRLLPKAPGKLVMTFRPTEPPPVMAYVRFEGSAVLRAEDLQKAFYQVSVGVPYTEERLHELLDATARPLFEEKGRLQVRFGPFRTEESTEATGLLVNVPVADGDEFVFGKIRFAGQGLLAEKELERLAGLEEGELANFALVNKALAAIEARYQRGGYLKVKTAVERALSERTKTADLTIRIQQGDRYLFRRLEIKGLDINAGAAVSKRWGIQRGQPFDASYPEVFRKRIEEEGMFDQLAKTASRVTVDEEAKMVDVELVFTGEPAKPVKRGVVR